MPRRSRKNKKYSAELKMQAVQPYLNGEGGLDVVCRKYGILSNHQLRDWILWYNGHGGLVENLKVRDVLPEKVHEP